MYARRGSARMRGSAVVQGLQAWAESFHPQLSLSQRKSQRLLTALTSSFRRQLGGVHHPSQTTSGDEARPTLPKGDASKTRNQAIHASSAAFADRRLASVLTNPPLTNEARPTAPSKPDYRPYLNSVIVTLQENPAKDPFVLLEEYQKKGHANISIAVACLEFFKKSVDGLPKDKRLAVIRRTCPGKRSLYWAWHSKAYQQEAFITDHRFRNLMVPFLVDEGSEKYIWDWLQMDMKTGAQPEGLTPLQTEQRGLRWKGVLARNLVMASADAYGPSLDEALKVYFQCLDIKDASRMSINPTLIYLLKLLLQPERRYATDPKLFDRLVLACQSRHPLSSGVTTTEGASALELVHPRSPSPLPALRLLRSVFDSKLNENLAQPLIQTANLAHPLISGNRGKTRWWYTYCMNTIIQLQDLSRNDDADWVIALAKKLYPQSANRVERDVAEDREKLIKWQKAYLPVEQEPNREETTQPKRAPMSPFPIPS